MKQADTNITKTSVKSIVQAVTQSVACESGDDWSAWLLSLDINLWNTVILNNEYSSWHKAAETIETKWDYLSGNITSEQAGIPF